MSIELAILTPVLVALFLLLVAAGRLVDVKNHLEGAARDGARAASVARTLADAQAFAEDAVEASLEGTSFCDGEAKVAEVAGEWEPGGYVTVEVACKPNMEGLGLVGLGAVGDRKGKATAPIDTYRRLDCGGQPCVIPGEGDE